MHTRGALRAYSVRITILSMLAILDLNVKQAKFVTFGIRVYYVLLYW